MGFELTLEPHLLQVSSYFLGRYITYDTDTVCVSVSSKMPIHVLAAVLLVFATYFEVDL